MNSDIRWMGLEHKAIFEMINAGPGANASDAPADFWGTLSAGLNEISATLHQKLGDLNVNWEGVSAEQALSGMSPLKEWAGKAESGSNVMKSSFELQGNYVSDARHEVPPPKQVTTPEPSGWQMVGAGAAAMFGNPGPAAAVALQAADHEAQERASDEAARKAVQAMQKYEKSSDWNADTLGNFEEPPKLVVDTPPPAPGLHSGSVDSSGMHGTTSVHHNQQTQPNAVHHSPIGSQSAPSPNVTPNQHVPQNSHTSPNQLTPMQNYSTPPQNHPGLPPKAPMQPPFPPSGGQPNQWGGGPFVSGGGQFGGGQGPGTGGRPGIPGGGVGSGGGGQNSSGRGGLGNANAGFGPNSSMDEARQGRPGAGAGPGGSNMGPGGRGGQAGMGPGGGGRQADGEDDTEHETPDYLMETEDIFGDERTIAPSVIGEKPEQ
nr:PPE domain-containing protein [Kibdelosporangium sp. MJ126-NF4]CEL15721.1 Translation initiation factor 2 [Kibdelosporangium sp. MJ126-NF4]CTQ93646.1 Translation initiation factor 2 [Kibdelosporangium sp. MJ126-NF4]